MFTWAGIAKLALQLALAIVSWLKEKQLMDAGTDREIARVSASILAKTAAAKGIAEHLATLTEAQVDAELKDLEPK